MANSIIYLQSDALLPQENLNYCVYNRDCFYGPKVLDYFRKGPIIFVQTFQVISSAENPLKLCHINELYPKNFPGQLGSFIKSCTFVHLIFCEYFIILCFIPFYHTVFLFGVLPSNLILRNFLLSRRRLLKW